MGLRAGLEGCGKSRSHRDSIRGPSSMLRVAIAPELLWPKHMTSHTRSKSLCLLVSLIVKYKEDREFHNCRTRHRWTCSTSFSISYVSSSSLCAASISFFTFSHCYHSLQHLPTSLPPPPPLQPPYTCARNHKALPPDSPWPITSSFVTKVDIEKDLKKENNM
jgi:hypothetical protein